MFLVFCDEKLIVRHQGRPADVIFFGEFFLTSYLKLKQIKSLTWTRMADLCRLGPYIYHGLI